MLNYSYFMLSSNVFFLLTVQIVLFFRMFIISFSSLIIVVTLLVTKQLQRFSVNCLNTYSAILCKM